MNFEEDSISAIPPLINTHRHLLREQMDEIIAEQDQLENILNEQFRNPQSHPLMKKIDEWEKESIEKIQQRAEKLREQLLQLTIKHTRQLSNKLQELSNKLINIRALDTFIEIDLEHWKQTLDDLKAKSISPSTITIDYYFTNPLVPDIYVALIVKGELFLQTADDKVRIEENGQLIIHDLSLSSSEIRGRNAYTTGCHKIRLRMVQYTNKWTFLGINSQSTPLRSQFYSSPSSYGWSSNQFIWSKGEAISTPTDKRIVMENDDIISLIIDCDKSFIIMINERLNIKHELRVDADHCPFPWQLYVILNEPNSHLQILDK